MTPPEIDLRYPIGRYHAPQIITNAQRGTWISVLGLLPENLKRAVAGLSDGQLDTPYRPGGWSVRQVVHHLADSHMNSYIRIRLALTESSPLIKPYNEAAWAELADARTDSTAPSLLLLEALHLRWISLLNTLTDEQFARTFKHPELGEVRLDWTLGLYAWHSRHHVAQITGLRERMEW